MRDLPRPVIKSGVPCIARQILNHWTIREAPIITGCFFFFKVILSKQHSAGQNSLEKSENMGFRVPQKSYINVYLISYCI